MIFEYENDKIVIMDDTMSNRVMIEDEVFMSELANAIRDDYDNFPPEEEYTYIIGNIEVHVSDDGLKLTDLTSDLYDEINVTDKEDLRQLPILFEMVVEQLEYTPPSKLINLD